MHIEEHSEQPPDCSPFGSGSSNFRSGAEAFDIVTPTAGGWGPL